jgi:hypothetical protein
VKNGRATGTADNYKPVLSLLKTRYGRTAAIDFGPLALKALRKAMIDQGQARRYVNENVHRIRKVFRWAASEQLIPASVPESLWTVEGLHKGLGEARETAPVVIVEDAIVEATSRLPSRQLCPAMSRTLIPQPTAAELRAPSERGELRHNLTSLALRCRG